MGRHKGYRSDEKLDSITSTPKQDSEIITDLQRQLREADDDRHGLGSRVLELEGENEQLRHQLREAKGEIDKLRDRRRLLREENEQLHTKIKIMEGERFSNGKKIVTLQNQNEQLRHRVGMLSKEEDRGTKDTDSDSRTAAKR